MFFKISDSVAANTTEATLETQVLKIAKGLLNLWVVYMTKESGDFLKVRVKYHGVQVYPFTMGQAIKAWFTPIPVTAKLKIDTPPYELTVEAWNTATTNAHEYHVHCNVEPEKPVKVVETSDTLMDRFKALFGG